MSSTEFLLLVDCCRAAFKHSREDLAVTPPAELDWSLFLTLARRHRVQGLVWDSLLPHRAVVPDEIASALSAEARTIAVTNLRIAMESRAIFDRFREAGVPLLFLKGLTLAALSYRTPFQKMGWDIDILVPEGQVDEAAQLLATSDYVLVTPEIEVSALPAWHGRHKESTWRKGDIYVELHSRLTDNPHLLHPLQASPSTQDVPVSPGITLPTLGPDDLFAYLAVHGASSAWFRLKWISDFAAFIAGWPAGELERRYGHALSQGAGRAPGQALLLADRLFGSLEGSALRDALARDRAAKWLADIAYRQLTGRLALREPTETRLGTAMIHFSQLALLPGVPFKLGEARRQLRSAFDHLRM